MLAWHVMHCKPRQEFRVQQNLVNQGFRTLLPQVRREVLRGCSKSLKTESLFPGYLFVQVNPETVNYNALRSTRGALSFVLSGSKPGVVPELVVNELQEYCDEDVANPLVIKRLKPGQEIEVTAGPFTGLRGIFDIESSEERCFVLLDFLGKQQRLGLDVASIAAA